MSENGQSSPTGNIPFDMPSDAAMYHAYVSRDRRFDGVFYIGVTSTGIYCRPVCTARTPRAANCRFFDSAEAAEKTGFRPCLRCRPELAPGTAPVDDAQRIATLIVHRMNEGTLTGAGGLEAAARRLGWSARQVRRIVQRELGVSPMELVLTRRLLLAKQLLTDTALSITEVAFASGFASLRRFNDAFRKRYGMAPTRFRRRADGGVTLPEAADRLALRLTYRAPFDWQGLTRFLHGRAMHGVELVSPEGYCRTVRLGSHVGWVHVRNDAERHALHVEIPYALVPALAALLGRLRHVFDLGARPDVIDAQLGSDPLLADAIRRHPGTRVPGAFDGFELAVRTVLGQQVSVQAATTLGGRFAEAFGDAIVTPYAGVGRLGPTPERIAALDPSAIAALGIVGARARTIVALADAVASGRLPLEPGGDVSRATALLVAIPGIGPWTASYIAMRALRSPDAFPKEDMVLRRNLGDGTPGSAERLSQAWRPWRSYATMYLWQAASLPRVLPDRGARSRRER